MVTQLTGIVGQLGQLAAAYPLVTLLQRRRLEHRVPGRGRRSALSIAVARSGRHCRHAARLGAAARPRPVSGVRGAAPPAARVAEPGTRLGLWTHFVTQFSGSVVRAAVGLPVPHRRRGPRPAHGGPAAHPDGAGGMVVGPVLGHLAGRWPLRRSAWCWPSSAGRWRSGRSCCCGPAARRLRLLVRARRRAGLERPGVDDGL